MGDTLTGSVLMNYPAASKVKRCTACDGSGQVLCVPSPNSGPMGISPWPTETCRRCGGSGWEMD